MPPADLPWLPRALQALDLRRKDRLLLAVPGSVAIAESVDRLVGPQGSITVLEPRRRLAEQIATALPQAAVLALEPGGDDHFGAFDAVLVAPFTAPRLEPQAWANLVANNLRPGGRFAIDLPAPDPLPQVREAASAAQLPFCDRLAQSLAGPDAAALATALQQRQLRRVESLLGAHLMACSSPFDLADLVAAAARLDDDEQLQLGEALARRLGSTAAVETLMHRTAIAGMR